MNNIQKLAANTTLTEAEITTFIKENYAGSLGSITEDEMRKVFNHMQQAIVETRQVRALNESEADAQNLVDTITKVATSTFMTEAQLSHLVDHCESDKFGLFKATYIIDEAILRLNEARKEFAAMEDHGVDIKDIKTIDETKNDNIGACAKSEYEKNLIQRSLSERADAMAEKAVTNRFVGVPSHMI